MKMRLKAEVCKRLQTVSPDLFSAGNEIQCVVVTDVSVSLAVIWRNSKFLLKGSDDGVSHSELLHCPVF
jgi:hypothetical protein